MLSKYPVMLSLLVFVFLTTSLVSTVYSIEPKKENYEHAIASQMPNYLKIVDYNIEVEEQVGSKVDPIWVTRFNASIVPIENLYVISAESHDFEKHGFIGMGGKVIKSVGLPLELYENLDFFSPKPKSTQVYFLILKSSKNVPFKIFGKTSTKLYRGKLSIDFGFDGYPFNENEIGKPFSNSKAKPPATPGRMKKAML